MTQKHVLTGSSDRKGFTILCFSQEFERVIKAEVLPMAMVM